MTEIVSRLTPTVKLLTAAGVNVPVMQPMTPMNLNERARFARERERLKPQQAADAIGCARTTILRWEKDADSISSENLLKAAEVYKVQPAWLTMASEDDAYPWTPNAVREPLRAYAVEAVSGDDTPAGAIRIQHMEVEAHAGDGEELVFAPTKFPMYYRQEWFDKYRAKPEDVRSMRVSGASMEPVLWDGDRIAVHFNLVQRFHNDRVHVIRLDGATLVKRLFSHGPGGVRVVSENPNKVRYPDIYVDGEDFADRMLIYGPVIDKSGSGGL